MACQPACSERSCTAGSTTRGYLPGICRQPETGRQLEGHRSQGTLNLSILNQTEGSKIYYTTNGTDPNPSDDRYRGQNLQGRIVSTGRATVNEINTGQLDDGLYFLNYESSQQIYTAKFTVFR